MATLPSAISPARKRPEEFDFLELLKGIQGVEDRFERAGFDLEGWQRLHNAEGAAPAVMFTFPDDPPPDPDAHKGRPYHPKPVTGPISDYVKLL